MSGREIDGCRVEVLLEREVARWEEAVRGRCRFHGGTGTTGFTRVELHLHPPTLDGHVAALDAEPTASCDLEILPGAVVERAFELRIPPRAGLGPGASVVAIFHRRRSWIPATLVVPILLAPSRCFTDVLELTSRLTGLRPGVWHFGGQGDSVRIDLAPDPEQPRPVDALHLELFRANGVIYGHLTVDPVNVGLAGAVKNLTAADLVRLPLRFPEGDLESAAQQISVHLRPYVDERGRLPIPAAPDPAPDTLPLPSTTQPEALPLPAGSAGPHRGWTAPQQDGKTALKTNRRRHRA